MLWTDVFIIVTITLIVTVALHRAYHLIGGELFNTHADGCDVDGFDSVESISIGVLSRVECR